MEKIDLGIRKKDRYDFKENLWFIVFVVAFFLASALLTVRLWMTRIISLDSLKGITPPSYINAGTVLTLWEAWALFCLIVIVSLIFWVGRRA